jgi:hypothetical protein
MQGRGDEETRDLENGALPSECQEDEKASEQCRAGGTSAYAASPPGTSSSDSKGGKPLVPVAEEILPAIARLRAEQKKLRDERKKVTHELRNQMKRSKRLKDKARQLSNADLLTVMQMREVQEKQKQETAAKQKRAEAGSQAGSSGDTPASSNKKSKAGGSQTFSQQRKGTATKPRRSPEE